MISSERLKAKALKEHCRIVSIYITVTSALTSEGVGDIRLPTVGNIRIPTNQSQINIIQHLRQRKVEVEYEIQEINRAIAVIQRTFTE